MALSETQVNKAKAIAQRISLTDILSQPTEIRREQIREQQPIQNDSFETRSFPEESTKLIPEERPVPKTVEEEEPAQTYDAEKNAKALVYTMQTIDSMLLNLLCYFKTVNMVGGAKVMKKMKQVFTKDFCGIELTAQEKTMLEKYKVFESKMNMLSGEILLKPHQQQHLIDTATLFCEDTQFKMSSTGAFWASYAGGFVERATKILMK